MIRVPQIVFDRLIVSFEGRGDLGRLAEYPATPEGVRVVAPIGPIRDHLVDVQDPEESGGIFIARLLPHYVETGDGKWLIPIVADDSRTEHRTCVGGEPRPWHIWAEGMMLEEGMVQPVQYIGCGWGLTFEDAVRQWFERFPEKAKGYGYDARELRPMVWGSRLFPTEAEARRKFG